MSETRVEVSRGDMLEDAGFVVWIDVRDNLRNYEGWHTGAGRSLSRRGRTPEGARIYKTRRAAVASLRWVPGEVVGYAVFPVYIKYFIGGSIEQVGMVPKSGLARDLPGIG